MLRRLKKQTPNKLQKPLVLTLLLSDEIFLISVNLAAEDLVRCQEIEELFADLLNDNAITNVMIVGVGNMGRALLHYRFHERNKMKVVMAFDIDDHPEVGNTTNDGIPIYGISQIKEKIQSGNVQTAILTVPSVKAQEVCIYLSSG